MYVVVRTLFASRRQEVSLPLHVLASCVTTIQRVQQKLVKSKETTFSLCKAHKRKPEHPAKYFSMSTTSDYYISVLVVVYKFCIYSKHEGTTVKLA